MNVLLKENLKCVKTTTYKNYQLVRNNYINSNDHPKSLLCPTKLSISYVVNIASQVVTAPANFFAARR